MGLLAGSAIADESGFGPSEQPPSSGVEGAQTNPTALALPSYQPMFRDAAFSRVGSVTRGSVGAQDVMVLAPQRKGASATDQPTLIWYLPTRVERDLEVIIQERNADEPCLEYRLRSQPDQEIGTLAVGDYGIRLRPGIEYEWSVALVTDPARRSHDAFSMGSVEYVPPDPGMNEAIRQSSGSERVELLLSRGYWYDALLLLNAGAASGDELMADWQRQLLRGEGLLAGSRDATPLVPE